MGDLKLFSLEKGIVKSLKSESIAIEISLQRLIEKNLEEFLGVHLLASEYSTGPIHKGRIDTLGLDENYCPVILEFKRGLNENVINQGLFYLDWLMDHRAEFASLSQKVIGKNIEQEINWKGARVICIAGDFTRYDEYAVRQMNRNIELIRYKKYRDDLILLELVNGSTNIPEIGLKIKESSVEEKLAKASQEVKDRYETLKATLFSFGDDVSLNTLKNYFAFKRIKNFACVEIHPANNRIIIFVKSDFINIDLEPGFTRDVRKIGHYATGDLEITLSDDSDLEKAEQFLLRSYEDN
jgi:predicted transport protein